MENEKLVEKARNLVNPKKLSGSAIAGEVGSILITDKGNVYIGICLDTSCGLGFCAEQSAISSMLTNGESRIKTIVAVGKNGKVLPPCGRCRELVYQINSENKNTDVIVGDQKVLKLRDLLPVPWQDN